MINTNHVTPLFADAYSFKYYGAKNWQGCIDMLVGRGYNRIEVEAIMRSCLTRWATDRIETRRKANADDLADTMDNRMGHHPSTLRDYIDDAVLGIMQPEPEKLDSRAALRLVWSR